MASVAASDKPSSTPSTRGEDLSPTPPLDYLTIPNVRSVNLKRRLPMRHRWWNATTPPAVSNIYFGSRWRTSMPTRLFTRMCWAPWPKSARSAPMWSSSPVKTCVHRGRARIQTTLLRSVPHHSAVNGMHALSRHFTDFNSMLLKQSYGFGITGGLSHSHAHGRRGDLGFNVFCDCKQCI